MEDSQGSIRSLREIQRSTFSVLTKLNDADGKQTQALLEEYTLLVDHFNASSEHLAPQKHWVAKEDEEYFLRLIDLAIADLETSDKNPSQY